mmetsp:Transcript_3606/g.7373  ORF Transcript_3606/g.7373 Transcript_3606/m.7373 type:complete len:300 (+) Transcript_3606:492-1391(+)
MIEVPLGYVVGLGFCVVHGFQKGVAAGATVGETWLTSARDYVEFLNGWQVPYPAIARELPPQNPHIAGNKSLALGGVLIGRQAAHCPSQIGIISSRQRQIGRIIRHHLKVGHEIGHGKVRVHIVIRDMSITASAIRCMIIQGGYGTGIRAVKRRRRTVVAPTALSVGINLSVAASSIIPVLPPVRVRRSVRVVSRRSIPALSAPIAANAAVSPASSTVCRVVSAVPLHLFVNCFGFFLLLFGIVLAAAAAAAAIVNINVVVTAFVVAVFAWIVIAFVGCLGGGGTHEVEEDLLPCRESI